MSRLSDRAFQIVKKEIDRCYTDTPNDQLERVIMLARLENLRQQSGNPISKVELWEELSDISPKFNQKVIQAAANVDTTSPLVGVSIGISAVAVLVAAAVAVENLNAGVAATKNSLEPETSKQESHTQKRSSKKQSTQNNSPSNSQAAASPTATAAVVPNTSATAVPQFISTPKRAQTATTVTNKGAFETAKAFGWQAALKSQDPPHSAQHWRETATLWAQAIDLLGQVPRHNSNYAAAQAKKAVYQQNLQTIQAREQEALKVASNTTTTPQFSAPTESNLTIAKRYGWQAALASQNAPHPTQKWADISQLWQIAIQNLDRIGPQDPTFADAQQIKIQYQENLVAIRQRYQQEQNATQRLQSLQATLNEIEQSITLSKSSKKAQLTAIINRLQTIPANTVAHLQAQPLIEQTQDQLSTIAEGTSARLAVSTEVAH